MTLQFVLQGHRLHPVADQLLGILADLTVEPWILQRRPCLRDRSFLGAQSRERSGDPQRSNVIAACPGGFELAEFGFGGHCCGVVAAPELSKPNPLQHKGSERMEA